jgi:hypothetical protein
MAGPFARRVVYRVRQFISGLLAYSRALGSGERREVQAVLPEAALSLFAGMPRNDQRHSLNVLRALRAAGYHHPALLQAALLHDAAKRYARLTLLHRTAIVLLRAIRPGVLHGWTQGPEPRPGHWRRPFWVYARHAERGAADAAAAGCDPLACLLIRHHQDVLPVAGLDPAAADLLAVLQNADDNQ